MKKTVKKTVNTLKLFLFISVFCTAILQSQNLAMLKKVAILDFDTEIVDFGTIKQNSNGNRVFTFTNTGNAPLLIADVKASCGCTVPTYSKTPVLPGEKGQIEVEYDTKRVGAFSKTITITSNAMQNKKTIKIKGRVIAKK